LKPIVTLVVLFGAELLAGALLGLPPAAEALLEALLDVLPAGVVLAVFPDVDLLLLQAATVSNIASPAPTAEAL
jgi:hypothetical protein